MILYFVIYVKVHLIQYVCACVKHNVLNLMHKQLHIHTRMYVCMYTYVAKLMLNITEGEDQDFDATSPVRVLFPGGLTRVDFDVLMVDNVKLEGNKNFFISIDPLSLPYGVVLGDHPAAEVVIVDDEGMCVWKVIP